MQTFKRICLNNYSISDNNGNTLSIEKGKEYITSGINNAPAIGPSSVKNHVIVFTNVWGPVPIECFSAGTEFTPKEFEG